MKAQICEVKQEIGFLSRAMERHFVYLEGVLAGLGSNEAHQRLMLTWCNMSNILSSIDLQINNLEREINDK